MHVPKKESKWVQGEKRRKERGGGVREGEKNS